ncbi:TPA: hypothetical protein ACLA6T_000964, partial [Neisseria meningitidis]
NTTQQESIGKKQKQKPNGLDSRAGGNDEILSWGNLSENPNPKNRTDAAPSAPKPRFNHSNKQKEKTK